MFCSVHLPMPKLHRNFESKSEQRPHSPAPFRLSANLWRSAGHFFEWLARPGRPDFGDPQSDPLATQLDISFTLILALTLQILGDGYSPSAYFGEYPAMLLAVEALLGSAYYTWLFLHRSIKWWKPTKTAAVTVVPMPSKSAS